jgi:farnesyl diphosphate synthase
MPNPSSAEHLHLTRFEHRLDELITTQNIPAEKIREAMRYSLFPGGKRLRPHLVYLTGDLLGLPSECLDSMAMAIELIHAYSLIHDDLPAMDNDDMRRGKPSCHRAFDEATAILVGDALQPLAFDVLLTELPKTIPLPQVIQITQTLIQASGASGMVSGQSLDLSELANTNIREEQLKTVHDLKTGALMLACIDMPLAAANPSAQVTQALRSFATHLGLVFQMQDDYLDAYGPTEGLGKGRASDHENNKSTFATRHTKKALQQTIQSHVEQTEKALALFSDRAEPLRHFLHALFKQSAYRLQAEKQ